MVSYTPPLFSTTPALLSFHVCARREKNVTVLCTDAAPPLPEAAEVQPEDGPVARRCLGREARPHLPPVPLPAGEHQDLPGDEGHGPAGQRLSRTMHHVVCVVSVKMMKVDTALVVLQ